MEWLKGNIPLISGLIGKGIDAWRTKKAQKRQFAHDRAMAEWAYSKDVEQWNRQSQWNIDMWNRQNEFNLPENMMQRLRDAGLNPNLVATQGGAGGSATPIQKAESPKYQAVRANFNPMPMDWFGELSKFTSIKQADAQIDLTKEKALTEAVRRLGETHNVKLKGELAKYAWQLADAEVERKNYQALKTKTEAVFDNTTYLDRLEIVRQELGRKRADTLIRRMEKDLFEKTGLRPQDPIRYRLLSEGLQKVFPWLKDYAIRKFVPPRMRGQIRERR